jgi:hypothetical protein
VPRDEEATRGLGSDPHAEDTRWGCESCGRDRDVQREYVVWVEECLRLDVTRLTSAADAAAVLTALRTRHNGEQVVSFGFGSVRSAATEHALLVAREAASVAERVELRALRRPIRRALLTALEPSEEFVVHATARRKLVLLPGAPEDAIVIAALSTTRRKMLRLSQRDGERCVWCSTPLTHRSLHATLDHVRCRSAGGADALDNLVLACAPCNNRRADRSAALWLAACKRHGLAVDDRAVRGAIARSERHHGGVLPLAA